MFAEVRITNQITAINGGSTTLAADKSCRRDACPRHAVLLAEVEIMSVPVLAGMCGTFRMRGDNALKQNNFEESHRWKALSCIVPVALAVPADWFSLRWISWRIRSSNGMLTARACSLIFVTVSLHASVRREDDLVRAIIPPTWSRVAVVEAPACRKGWTAALK